MEIEHVQGLEPRIALLKAKLVARTGKKEFADNCKDIRTEIERLEKLVEERDALASVDRSEYDL